MPFLKLFRPPGAAKMYVCGREYYHLVCATHLVDGNAVVWPKRNVSLIYRLLSSGKRPPAPKIVFPRSWACNQPSLPIKRENKRPMPYDSKLVCPPNQSQCQSEFQPFTKHPSPNQSEFQPFTKQPSPNQSEFKPCKKPVTSKTTCTGSGDNDNDNRKKLWALGSLVLFGGSVALCLYYLYANERSDDDSKLTSQKKTNILKAVKDPVDPGDIPKKVPYVLIGGGAACYSAFRAIKCADKYAKVLMINEEGYLPYLRPPLSKELWYFLESNDLNNMSFSTWDRRKRSLFLEPDEFYAKSKDLMDLKFGGLGVALGWKVKKIDTVSKEIYLENGPKIVYGKCLIATGCSPQNLSVFDNNDPWIKSKVVLYKGIADFQKVYNNLDRVKSLVIVGGGLLSSELACSMSRHASTHKIQIHQIMEESGNLSQYLPEYLSKLVTDRVRKLNVNVVTNVEIDDARERHGQVKLTLNNGLVIYADQVIVAVGSNPNTEIAKESKLELDSENGGFLVNAELQAANDVYVAGDCACYYDKQLGRRRVEHYDHAVQSGKQAGKNMVGNSKPYNHQPMYWSDLGPDIGFEAVGLVDASLPTVSIFTKASENDSPRGVDSKNPGTVRSNLEAETTDRIDKCEKDDKLIDVKHGSYGLGKGVVFYLKDDKVVGVVLWNLYQRMFIARHVIEQGYKYDDLNDVAKLFDMFDED